MKAHHTESHKSRLSGRAQRRGNRTDAGSDVAVMPVRRAAGNLLALSDPGAVDVVLATLIANESEGDPLWMVLVSPPSNGKTELLTAASHAPNTHALSTLTKRTLISGQKADESDDREPSLLERLKGKTLILKDFTTILTLHRDDRSEILGVLREVYDGRVSKSFGTGKTYIWEGKMGLLAGCTPTIDRHWAVLSSLGERFLFYRLPSGGTEDRREQARRALEAAEQKSGLRDDLGKAICRSHSMAHGWYKENTEQVVIRPSIKETLITLADLTAKGRTPVLRDGKTRELIAPSDPEGLGRLVTQLRQLGLALCIIHGNCEPGAEELAILRKVARDTMPPFRARILGALTQHRGVTVADLEKETGLPHATASRELEDCRLLKLVIRDGEGWRLSPETREEVEASGIFS